MKNRFKRLNFSFGLFLQKVITFSVRAFILLIAVYLYYMHAVEMEIGFINFVADFLPVVNKDTDPVIILFWFFYVIGTLASMSNLSSIFHIISDYLFLSFKREKFKHQFNGYSPSELRRIAELPFWLAHEKNAIQELRTKTEIDIAKSEYL